MFSQSTCRIQEHIASYWSDRNSVLQNKEIGYETDTDKIKVGDGSSTWNNLSYWSIIPFMPVSNDAHYHNQIIVPAIITNNNQLTNGAGFITGITLAMVVTALGFTPSSKRRETYSGTSDANGAYTVTFSQAFSVAPNIQANVVNQSSTNQFIRITSVSTTGFTVNVFARNSINILGTDVLLFTTTNVNGAAIDVLITEK